jgi:hypothetical protein
VCVRVCVLAGCAPHKTNTVTPGDYIILKLGAEIPTADSLMMNEVGLFI